MKSDCYAYKYKLRPRHADREDAPMNKSHEFHTVRGYQLLDRDRRLLTTAMEDYLEMICRNVLSEGYIRINTLSELLNVKPSSATKMVQKLAALGLLRYEKYGTILLTERGEKLGRFLLNRHHTIERFLTFLGLREGILNQTELIEHNISQATLESIGLLVDFFEENPEVLSRFEAFRARSQQSNTVKNGEKDVP